MSSFVSKLLASSSLGLKSITLTNLFCLMTYYIFYNTSFKIIGHHWCSFSCLSVTYAIIKNGSDLKSADIESNITPNDVWLGDRLSSDMNVIKLFHLFWDNLNVPNEGECDFQSHTNTYKVISIRAWHSRRL